MCAFNSPSPSPPPLCTFAVTAVFICRRCCCFKRSIFTWNVIQLAEQCVGLNKHLGGAGGGETRWRLALAGSAALTAVSRRGSGGVAAPVSVAFHTPPRGKAQREVWAHSPRPTLVGVTLGISEGLPLGLCHPQPLPGPFDRSQTCGDERAGQSCSKPRSAGSHARETAVAVRSSSTRVTLTSALPRARRERGPREGAAGVRGDIGPRKGEVRSPGPG